MEDGRRGMGMADGVDTERRGIGQLHIGVGRQPNYCIAALSKQADKQTNKQANNNLNEKKKQTNKNQTIA